MDVKREKSIFRLLPRNSNFTWFLVTFALKYNFRAISKNVNNNMRSEEIAFKLSFAEYIIG